MDDWAFRRGRIYGTFLVNRERHCPIDLVPGRTAQTVVDWLRQHPGVEIVSRDRGGAYAEGIRQGAPVAVQVADRFHLLKHRGDALEAFLLRKHAVLRQAAPLAPVAHVGNETQRPASRPLALEPSGAQRTEQVPVPPPPIRTAEGVGNAERPRTMRAQHEREVRRARRRARYEAVQASARDGMTQREIARVVGRARGTVRNSLRAEAFPELGPRPRPSKLRLYEPYLREQWDAGVKAAAVLW